MSIELVDKIDQAQKSNRKYKKVGGLNDLFLHDEEASVTSHTTSGDEYVGLELETVIQKKDKKRLFLFVLFIMVLSALIGAAVVYHQSKSTDQNSTNARASPPGNENVRGSNSGTNSPVAADSKAGDSESVSLAPVVQHQNVIWPTTAPLAKFSICKPSLHYLHTSKAIHHMADVVIVPEDDDLENQWNYTFSSMDIDEHASVIAVGLSDFSGSSDMAFGMVRVFAFSCRKKSFEQLGQDLIGNFDGEMFGYQVSSSKDGMVMAVSAPQMEAEGFNGFVQVYYFDSDSNRWSILGQRIDDLLNTDECFSLGSAIDLSDNGETLAIAAATGDNAYVTRVFAFDYTSKAWTPKGHSISTTLFESDYDFNFDISLSEAGDELAIVNPTLGLMKYHFAFETDKWIEKEDTQKSVFENTDADMYWIEGVDFDESGDIVAMEALQECGSDEPFQIVKVFDYSNNSVTEVYNNSLPDLSITMVATVSNDGSVVALVSSRNDYENTVSWAYDSVGTMTVISKKHDGVWKTLSQSNRTAQVGVGVPGSEVALSADGSVAAVGTDSIIAVYTISYLNTSTFPTTSDEQTPSADVTIDDSAQSAPNGTAVNGTFFKICAPFQNASAAHVGGIVSLPQVQDEHVIEISLSGDGSLVAVGIDSWDKENRGMVRVFAWDCAKGKYANWGQDLFGSKAFDAFGQSVDISSDGKVLVVGASQPPPGRTGYVDIYTFGVNGLWALEERFQEVHPGVEDIGRKVRISSDGSTVAIHGSVVDEQITFGCGAASFIRVIEKQNGKWVNKGDDLIGSVPYDDFGNFVFLSFASDGSTLGVTGSYNSFLAKMYKFDAKKSNWTETIIPPIKTVNDDQICFDDGYDEYFDGSDISLSDDGHSVAISGILWSTGTTVVRLLSVDTEGNWTMSHDPIEYDDMYTASSIGISGNARTLAVGMDLQGDDKEEQGAMFVSLADVSDQSWKALGTIEGRNKRDLLGSRVSVSSDGQLAAASSRKGYISFFKVNQTLRR